tara:strand:- start:3058 stop:4032 length:975 start_codon:yes stop_codon:yes gene_type:complete
LKNVKILITGITGQDGIFVTKYLLENNPYIKIYGTSRSLNYKEFYRKLNYLNPKLETNNISIFKTELSILENVKKIISDIQPHSIYNLTGPSSVYESIKKPNLSKAIEIIYNNLTLACINESIFPNFFQASSSEMYGKNHETILNEKSMFLPNSPYAEAKLGNHIKTAELRSRFNWNIVSGIMFNHESEFRTENYLFMKIINYLLNINNLPGTKLTLGGVDLVRDWSHASDISKGIVDMTENKISEDFVLGSGKPTKISHLLDISFGYFNLDWNEYVEVKEEILRKDDPIYRISDPSKIKKMLNWNTVIDIEEILRKIIRYTQL